jgi:hypothetical protein
MNSILSDGTGRYRRNTIIVAFVLLLMWFVPGTDFSGAGFFGIKIAASDKRAELLVVGVMLAVLVYQFGLFLFYATLDFENWIDKRDFPKWATGTIFGRGIDPKRVKWGSNDGLLSEVVDDGTIQVSYLQSNRGAARVFTMGPAEIAKHRRPIRIFIWVDLFFPNLLAVWAIMLISWRCYVLATEIWCLY